VTAEVFGTDGIVVLLVLVVLIGVPVWAIVDIARQPAMTSGAKTGWILGLVVGTLLFGLVGLIVALVYLIGFRPRLGSTA